MADGFCRGVCIRRAGLNLCLRLADALAIIGITTKRNYPDRSHKAHQRQHFSLGDEVTCRPRKISKHFLATPAGKTTDDGEHLQHPHGLYTSFVRCCICRNDRRPQLGILNPYTKFRWEIGISNLGCVIQTVHKCNFPQYPISDYPGLGTRELGLFRRCGQTLQFNEFGLVV